jgi:hypothetical protein
LSADRARLLMRLNAGFDALLGAVLVLSTWDGLYVTLDLPKASPALFTQLGGIALVALAYLLWVAAGNALLRRPLATVAAGAHAAAAVTTLLWLLFRGEKDLQVAGGGMALLWVLAAVLAAFAVAVGLVARSPEEDRRAPS